MWDVRISKDTKKARKMQKFRQ